MLRPSSRLKSLLGVVVGFCFLGVAGEVRAEAALAAPAAAVVAPALAAPAPVGSTIAAQAAPPAPAPAPPAADSLKSRQLPPETGSPVHTIQSPVPERPAAPAPEFVFGESYPAETTLDHKDIPDAVDIWIQLVNQATQSLDFAEFYASDDSTSKTRLQYVTQAIEAAARRGVPIRFLTEEKFYRTYPQVVDWLARLPNTQVRRLDSAAFDGGVLHCKYFIVNGQKCWIGSQNFDWRSLEHIQELGALVDNREFTGELKDLFELDWTIAGLVKPGAFPPGAARALVDSLVTARRKTARVGSVPLRIGYEKVWIRPVMSPTGRILNERFWDEPRLEEMIASARDSIDIQVLTYNDIMKDGKRYDVLRKALRKAAGRGVAVRLIVADWSKRSPTIRSLRELARTKNIEIRFMDIPLSSKGFIPFARVAHAKYMVVDAKKFWLGTSNWEYDYFHASRNVGIVGEGNLAGRQLAGFFDLNWNSTYAEKLDPKKEYEAPRVAQ